MAGLAGDGVLTTRVAYTPLQRAQKVKGRQEVLTKVRSLGETVQGQLSTVACGGARAELGDGDDGVLLRASFPYGTMRCRAVKVVQGSGGPEMRRRRVIAVGSVLTEAALR